MGFGTDLGASIPAAPTMGTASDPQMQSFSTEMAQTNTALARAQQVASVPQAVGHNMTMPTSLMPRNNAAPQAAMNTTPAVGKHNAKMRGIGNAITGVLNAVSAVGTAIDNQKSLKVADATQKLFSFQNSIDEASQIQKPEGSSDPKEWENYFQAQKTIETNKQKMEELLSDKTIHSALEKASVIDHTDPKSQDTPEHKGFFQGKKAFEEQKALAQQRAEAARVAAGKPSTPSTPRADNFGRNQPTSYGANPQAVARVQQLQAQQQNIIAQQKNYAEMVKSQLQYAGRMDPEILRSATEAYKITQTRLLEFDKLAQEHKNRLGEENYSAQMKVWVEKQNQYTHDTDPEKIKNDLEAASKAHSTFLSDNAAKSVAILKQIKGTSDQGIIKELRGQYDQLQKSTTDADQIFSFAKTSAAKLAGVQLDALQLPDTSVGGTSSGNQSSSPATDGKPSGGNPSSPDVNPYTGKPFADNVPVSVRLAVKGKHAIGASPEVAEELLHGTESAFQHAAHATINEPKELLDSASKIYSDWTSQVQGLSAPQ